MHERDTGPSSKVGSCLGIVVGGILGLIGGVVYHYMNRRPAEFHMGGLQELEIIFRAFVGVLIGAVAGLILGLAIGSRRGQ